MSDMEQGNNAAKIRAGAVHLLTALGVIPALLSFVAIFNGDPAMALIWIGVALVVDGLDGPLARRFNVREVMPGIDGAILDHVIDYMTYAILPALFIYQFGVLPDGFNLPAAGFIMFTALYCFANTSMKTDDYFFSGFPAAWNFIILFFYLTQSHPWVNVAVIALFGILTFIPFKYIHPLRVKAMRPVTITLTLLWSVMALYLVDVRATGVFPAQAEPIAFWIFIAVSAWFVGLSAWRSLDRAAFKED